MHTRKPGSTKSARGPLRGALALVALLVTGRGLVACGDGAVNAAKSGDAGANDATSDASGAMVDAADATLPVPDAMDAGDSDGEAADGAQASCAVDAGPLDDAQVALGQTLLYAHRCNSCHGETLSGNFDGVLSPTTEGGVAYPPNLTSDPATGLGCWTNAQIENAILNGIDDQGARLCPPMPLFGHIDGGLDAAQAQAVVQYLRSLPVISHAVPSTPDCTQVPTLADAQSEASADAQAEAAADAQPEASVDASVDSAADAAGAAEGGD